MIGKLVAVAICGLILIAITGVDAQVLPGFYYTKRQGTVCGRQFYQ